MVPRQRLATTPICWGFVGGGRWGIDLPTDRVLAEMAALGFGATEAGVPTFLPADVGAARALLDAHGLRVVAGAQSFIAHEPSQMADAVAATRAGAARLEALGADVMMTVPKRGDLPVGERLDPAGWRRVFDVFAQVDEVLADHGLRQALHPHVDSLVETAEDMTTVLEGCDVGWCFDTAHVASGGMDPVAFVTAGPTINHVHLKDAHLELGRQMVDHEVGFADAIQRGSSSRWERATSRSPRSSLRSMGAMTSGGSSSRTKPSPMTARRARRPTSPAAWRSWTAWPARGRSRRGSAAGPRTPAR